MTEIWYVEDFMSKQVLGNRYYSEKDAAVKYRNELGYGLVTRYQFQDGGVIPERKGSDLMMFRAAPSEKVEIARKSRYMPPAPGEKQSWK